jgi:hypothetical protein
MGAVIATRRAVYPIDAIVKAISEERNVPAESVTQEQIYGVIKAFILEDLCTPCDIGGILISTMRQVPSDITKEGQQ